MKFTFTEWTILAHRLEVADAIGECLVDELESERWGETEIVAAAERLLKTGNDNMNGKSTTVTPMYILDMIVIQEAANGSTFFASMDDAVEAGEYSKDQARRFNNAADDIEAMLEVTIPRR